MSAVEAAASLFDSEDSASDPFAALNTNEITIAVNGSEDILPANESAFEAELATSDHQHSYTVAHVPALLDQSSQSASYAFAPYDPPYVSDTDAGGVSHDQSQGWHGVSSQWQAYEQPKQDWHTNERAQAQRHAPKSHDPYAPVSGYAPPSPSATQDPHLHPHQLYETPVADGWGAPTGMPVPSAYYQPSPNLRQPQQFSSQFSPTQTAPSFTYAHGTPYTPLSPPPAPVMPISRPKAANAYDPPILPNKPRRAAVSRPAYSASPPMTKQMYHAYETYASPTSTASDIPAASTHPGQRVLPPDSYTSQSYSYQPSVAPYQTPRHETAATRNNTDGSYDHYESNHQALDSGGLSSHSQTVDRSLWSEAQPLSHDTAANAAPALRQVAAAIPREPQIQGLTGVQTNYQADAPYQQLPDTGHERGHTQDWSVNTADPEMLPPEVPIVQRSRASSTPAGPHVSGLAPEIPPPPCPRLPPQNFVHGEKEERKGPAITTTSQFVTTRPASAGAKIQQPLPRATIPPPPVRPANGTPFSHSIHNFPVSTPSNGVDLYVPAAASQPLPTAQVSPSDIPQDRHLPSGNNVQSTPAQHLGSISLMQPTVPSLPVRPINEQQGSVDPYSPLLAAATTSREPQTTYTLASSSTYSSQSDDIKSLNGKPLDSSTSDLVGTTPSFGSGSAMPSFVAPMTSWNHGSQSSQPLIDPYAPPKNDPLQAQDRSVPNMSALSSTSDAYRSFRHDHQGTSETSDYGVYSPRNDSTGAYGYESSWIPRAQPHGSEAVPLAATHTPYAPSPSLLASNDPLGRHHARVPVFSFGFGGKVVTCFHGSSDLNTGFDVALSSRKSTDIRVRILHSLVPGPALDSTTASYPGPLFLDPGTPITSLVRSGAAAQAKSKKASVTKYLDDRAEEISSGIGYLHANSVDKRRAEGKLVLVKLLKVMVENDGHLSGNTSIDSAARLALLPQLDFTTGIPRDAGFMTPALGVSVFSQSSDLHPGPADSSTLAPSGSIAPQRGSSDAPISTSVLRPSALDKIQTFLVRGERREAYHYALDQKLWPHAMLIASSIDKEAWQEAANEFLKSELGVTPDSMHRPTPSTRVSGREPLRVAYKLYSGQGATAVQELSPASMLLKTPLGGALSPAAMPPAMSSPAAPQAAQGPQNFSLSPVTASIPPECLAQWPETAAMIMSTPLSLDASAALTALGDHLLANQWAEAAHACYMLSPQTSPLGGIGNPSARIVLLGSLSPQNFPTFCRDPDAIVFSEILEFALSLASAPKGQDPFQGLPHLQPYRLLRAHTLMELGHARLASRYCEAITATLSRPSPYYTPTFLQQLQGLSERILMAPNIDKSGSWIGGKMAKPSLDSIGNWLEGRFTKLITGEGEPLPPSPDIAAQSEQRAFVGPFSHYSTISSAPSSASQSPQLSVVNLNTLPPPRRTGSAMGIPSAPVNHHIDRASSAMDYVRRKPSPAPRVATNVVNPGPSQNMSFGHAANRSSPPGSRNASQGSIEPLTPKSETTDEAVGNRRNSFWWGASYNATSSDATPTAGTFFQAANATQSTGGYVSRTQDSPGSAVLTSSSVRLSHSDDLMDEEDDLGLGNSKPKPKPASSTEEVEVPSETTDKTTPQQTQHSGSQDATAGGWFSRWWKKSDGPGPTKASLGEESSFYYDKELKRWVNKTAGNQPEKPAPPPPRAQTASPGHSRAPPKSMSPIPPTPPARSASAVDLTTSPPAKSALRLRSNLIPPPETDSEDPHPPLGLALPPSRPKSSQTSKRNIRSRYVDVLQGQGT